MNQPAPTPTTRAAALAAHILPDAEPYTSELAAKLEHRPDLLDLADRDLEAAREAVVEEAVATLRAIAGQPAGAKAA